MLTKDLRVSASRVKSLKQCAYKLYLNEVLYLPEKTHIKTHLGSLAHSILECLLNPRHIKIYNEVLSKQSIVGIPSLDRMARNWKRKYFITDEVMDGLDGCIMTGILHSDYEDKDSLWREIEWEFKITGQKYHAKGFLDKLVGYEKNLVIKDYKTLGLQYKTEKELIEEFEIQGTIYQLAVWKKFKLPASVEFYLLRYPPTKKKPERHIRVIAPKTEAQLRGAEMYYEFLGGGVFKNFGLEQAHSNFAADDEKGKRFCQYICKFKDPFNYISIVKDGRPVRGHFVGEPYELAEGETAVAKTHEGCPRFYKIS